MSVSINNHVILSGYASAVLVARMICHDENPWLQEKQQWRIRDVNKSMIVTKEGNRTYLNSNPDYIPLTEEERTIKDKEKDEADKFENESVYEKLKKEYPDKDYAGRFYEEYLKEEINNE